MFAYIRTRFRITLIGGNVTAQSTESQGNWRWNSNSRGVVASSPSFCCLWESCSQDTLPGVGVAAAYFPSVIIVNLSQQQSWFVLTLLAPRVTNINFLLPISTHFQKEKVMRIYKIITKEEMLSSCIKFSSPNGSLKNDMVFSHFGQFSVVLSFQKSIYYYFIINTISCKTYFADTKEWAPWTVEWGGRNCECGLQGHFWLDSAKATSNCFRATCTRIQTDFWNCITFHPDSCRRGLKPHWRAVSKRY